MVNRILAAVSTFYEYLVVTEATAAGEKPLQKIPDSAAADVVRLEKVTSKDSSPV